MLLMTAPADHSMYYIAILCPPQLDEKIRSMKQWMKEQFGCIVALKSTAHITMIPPFWLENRKETALLEALKFFSSDMDELLIGTDGFSHFGKKVLFVKVNENPALEELKSQVEHYFRETLGEGIKKDDRPFHPHITIANRDMKPCDFEKAWQHFAGRQFTEAFRTRTISLLKLGSGKWNVIGEKDWR